MKRSKFFETYREAAIYRSKHYPNAQFTAYDLHGIGIYDLKKIFPRRIKTRYFVGTYIAWLNIQ